MIEQGWYDEAFVRRWTNGPLLVRTDTRRLLRGSELTPEGEPESSRRLGRCHRAGRSSSTRPLGARTSTTTTTSLSRGRSRLPPLLESSGAGRPSTWSRTSAEAWRQPSHRTSPALLHERSSAPRRSFGTTGPYAFYTWSGLEQHSDTTQIIRAVNVLYALTGCLDAPGGNVLFTPVPANPVGGMELLDQGQSAKAIGISDSATRHSPVRVRHRRGSLHGGPGWPSIPTRGLMSFGSNLLMAQGDGPGSDAPQKLDFHVHLDMFMTPTAEQADVVLPVTERGSRPRVFKIGFEVSQDAQSLVQLRAPLVPPVGEARSDIQIIFDLATRPWAEQSTSSTVTLRPGGSTSLATSGITVQELRDHPAGVRLPLETRHRKYATVGDNGLPAGFATPTGRDRAVRGALWRRRRTADPHLQGASACAPGHGQTSPPSTRLCSPARRTCTSAKPSTTRSPACAATPLTRQWSCTQRLPDHGITEGDWVEISTPKGSIRARATFNEHARP